MSVQIPSDIEVRKDFLKHQIPQQLIAEWELEILAKEVILNGGVVSTKGRTLRSWKFMAETVDQLKKLENDIYGLRESSGNILFELYRIAHRQFVWQGNPPNSISTIRYFKVFEHPTINQVCLDRLGLTVKDIYLCGVAFMGVYLSRPAINTPVKSNVNILSKNKIEKFLSFTCRTVSELKPLLKSEQQYDDKFAYAYNSLRAFPLIRMRFRGNDAVVCPLPTLLYWRVTGGLYYEFLDDNRFPQAFGESFQKYVGQVIERACPEAGVHLLGEQEYGTKKMRKDSVDWIVSHDSSAIFLECKAKRLSWGAKAALNDLGPLEADIDNMASAIVQVYKTIDDYIDDQYPHFSFATNRKIYPIIVTLENWHVFGHAMLDRLQGAVVAKLGEAEISPDVLNEMPYSVCSIEDLEVGMQIISAVGIQDFLDGKLRDTEMRRWGWHSYMSHRFPERFPAAKLFADEYDEIFSGIED
jgi:hypothetical protein